MPRALDIDQSRPWFRPGSGWPDDVPQNPDFEAIALGRMLADVAERWPSRQALRCLDTTLTFRQLDHLVTAFASGLHLLGLAQGDVVALALPSCPQFVIAFYGANRIGCIPTSVAPGARPPDLRRQLRLTEAKVLVCLEDLYEPLAAPIIDETPVETLVVTSVTELTELGPIDRFLGRLLGKIPSGPTPITALGFSELLRGPAELPRPPIDPQEDPATYLPTRRTAGSPAVAVLTHFNLLSNATQCGLWLAGASKTPRPESAAGVATPAIDTIGALPLAHPLAMTVVMNLAIRTGGRMLLFPRPPRDPAEIFRALPDRSAPPGAILVGDETLFRKMLDHPEVGALDLGNRLIAAISAPCSPPDDLGSPLEEISHLRLVGGYALPEASPVVSAAPISGTTTGVGLPLPGTEWRLTDPATGAEIQETGEEHTGEIRVAGPQIMKEYLRDPAASAAALTKSDGRRWLRTGDVGFMDELGRVTLCDRERRSDPIGAPSTSTAPRV